MIKCPNCGSQTYSGKCVNCDEEYFLLSSATRDIDYYKEENKELRAENKKLKQRVAELEMELSGSY